MASTTTCRPAAGRERGSLDVEPVEAVGLCVSLVATRKAMTAAALFAPPPVTCPEASRRPDPEGHPSDDAAHRDRPERARVHRTEALVAEPGHRAWRDPHRPEEGPVDLGQVDVRLVTCMPSTFSTPSAIATVCPPTAATRLITGLRLRDCDHHDVTQRRFTGVRAELLYQHLVSGTEGGAHGVRGDAHRLRYEAQADHDEDDDPERDQDRAQPRFGSGGSASTARRRAHPSTPTARAATARSPSPISAFTVTLRGLVGKRATSITSRASSASRHVMSRRPTDSMLGCGKIGTPFPRHLPPVDARRVLLRARGGTGARWCG